MEAYPSAIYNQYKCDTRQSVKQCVLHNISSEQTRVHLKPSGKNNVLWDFPPSKKDEVFLQK